MEINYKMFSNVVIFGDCETCLWLQAQVLWGRRGAQGAGARTEQFQTDGGSGAETQADRGDD